MPAASTRSTMAPPPSISLAPSPTLPFQVALADDQAAFGKSTVKTVIVVLLPTTLA